MNLALKQVKIKKKIPYNPAADCKLSRAGRREIKPLDSAEIEAFRKAVKGNQFEVLYTLDLFAGTEKGGTAGFEVERCEFQSRDDCD